MFKHKPNVVEHLHDMHLIPQSISLVHRFTGIIIFDITRPIRGLQFLGATEFEGLLFSYDTGTAALLPMIVMHVRPDIVFNLPVIKT